MNDIEIFLNRLLSEKELFADISARMGNDSVEDRDTLAAALMNIDEPVKFRIYISNESLENDCISEITETFRQCGANSSNIMTEIIEDEFLNLIDDEAHLTAEAKPRTLVHRDGNLHPAVHIWIIKRKDMGIYVLLQKRSHEKKINPDCYDVSAAGHVSQGEEFRKTAVRETAEELGLEIHGSSLEFIGLHHCLYEEENIQDNELRAVYLCRENVDIDKLVLQSSEVSDVCWAEIDELLAVMDEGEFKHCLDLSELAMIKKAVF